MKYLILFLFPHTMSAQPTTVMDTIPAGAFPLGLSLVSYGESELSLPWDDCGTWESLPEELTDWVPVDTIGSTVDTTRVWVYDEERILTSNMITLEYAPCGKGTPTRYRQKRVCATNGIIEERYRIIRYKYTPKPKSNFQRIIELLRSK